MDIQGYIVEKLSGQTFSRIYAATESFRRWRYGMRASCERKSVTVSFRSMMRISRAIWSDGGLLPGTGAYAEHRRTMPSGGGGMVSTAEDYYRFAQMSRLGRRTEWHAHLLGPLDGGADGDKPVLANLLTGEFSIGTQVLRPGFGYGYDCAVIFDPLEADLLDGKGTFFWGGAAGTWFWIESYK